MDKSKLWDKLKEEMEIKAEGKYVQNEGYQPDRESAAIYEKMCQMEILAGITK